MIERATILRNGAAQVLQLPEDFDLAGEVVLIKRVGSAVLLLPLNSAWDVMAEAITSLETADIPDRDQPREVESREPL